MKKILNLSTIEKMLIGSSVYSTGGGLDYGEQQELFKRMLKGKTPLKLFSLDEFDDNDYICTSYSVGSSGNKGYDRSHSLQIGLRMLEQYIGKKIKGIFAGETNIDALVFQAACQANLPVVDGDSNGGRAVPEIQYDNFILAKKDIVPLVVVTGEGNVSILTHVPDYIYIEKFVRQQATQSKYGNVVVVDHAIQVKDAKKILTLGIFERGITTGQHILSTLKSDAFANDILTFIDATILIEGAIEKIELVNDKTEGFLKGYFYVKDRKGNSAKIFVKNETLLCWVNEKLVATCPDSIIVIDLLSGKGTYNSKLKVGQKVAVFAKKAEGLWATKEARKLFNPKNFGF